MLRIQGADPFSNLQAAFTLLPVRFMRAVSCLVGQQHHPGASRLKGDQLFDMICIGIFLVTVLFLRHLNAGSIYFWIKDLTHEFLKLQVIYTAVELFDKVLIFGSISQNCTQLLYETALLSLFQELVVHDAVLSTQA